MIVALVVGKSPTLAGEFLMSVKSRDDCAIGADTDIRAILERNGEREGSKLTSHKQHHRIADGRDRRKK